MTSDNYASLHENLDDVPLHAEVRAVLRAQVERGVPVVEVVEAGFATVTALCVDAEGLAKTAVRLMAVGSVLANASPEVQAQVAAEQRRAGATAH